MSVALDTNIIVYALIGESKFADPAGLALATASARGQRMVISPPVYAELLAIPAIQKTDIDEFLAATMIIIDWNLTELCWVSAGIAYAAYAVRRKRQKVVTPRRLLADFIIGAHAMEQGNLLTADARFYRTNFPELALITP